MRKPCVSLLLLSGGGDDLFTYLIPQWDAIVSLGVGVRIVWKSGVRIVWKSVRASCFVHLVYMLCGGLCFACLYLVRVLDWLCLQVMCILMHKRQSVHQCSVQSDPQACLCVCEPSLRTLVSERHINARSTPVHRTQESKIKVHSFGKYFWYSHITCVHEWMLLRKKYI